MRALITGATGFVGSKLLALLLEQGDEVAVLRRPGGDPWRIGHRLPSVRTIWGDLSDVEQVEPQVTRFVPEVVFHLAWRSMDRAARRDPAQQFANRHASLSLLRIAAEAGCRTWVGLGSQAEYGFPNRVVDESILTAPRDAYGMAKVETCSATRRLAADLGVRFLWLRLFSAYGPADHPSAFIPYVAQTLLRGERPCLTTGTQLWDYLYVADAADAICRAAQTRAAEGIFNLGSGEALPIREVAERIRDLINPRLPLGFGEMPIAADSSTHLQADVSRLVRVTGWQPSTSLDEGLARTVDWYRQAQARGPAAA